MIDRTLFTLPGVRKILPALGGLALLQALCILGQALFLSQAITGLWQDQELMQVLIYIIGFFLSFFGREVVNFLRQYMLDKVSYRLAADMRGQILEKAFKLGPSVSREMGTGNLTSTVISGIDEVETYIKLVLSKVLNMMIIPILLLIAIAFLDLQTAIVLAIAFPFAIIFMILLGYAAQGQADRQYKSFQLLSNHFLDLAYQKHMPIPFIKRQNVSVKQQWLRYVSQFSRPLHLISLQPCLWLRWLCS